MNVQKVMRFAYICLDGGKKSEADGEGGGRGGGEFGEGCKK